MNLDQLVLNFSRLNAEKQNQVLRHLVESSMIMERTLIGDLRTQLNPLPNTVDKTAKDHINYAANKSWSAIRALGALREV